MLNLSVDIRHWLDAGGGPAEPVRRKALWIARMIEYGGPLESGFSRETLIECTQRPKRRPCAGLMWVAKRPDGIIEAWCGTCEQLNVWVTKTGDAALERVYARHFVWPGKGPFHPPRPRDEGDSVA